MHKHCNAKYRMCMEQRDGVSILSSICTSVCFIVIKLCLKEKRKSSQKKKNVLSKTQISFFLKNTALVESKQGLTLYISKTQNDVCIYKEHQKYQLGTCPVHVMIFTQACSQKCSESLMLAVPGFHMRLQFNRKERWANS